MTVCRPHAPQATVLVAALSHTALLRQAQGFCSTRSVDVWKHVSSAARLRRGRLRRALLAHLTEGGRTS